MSLFGDFSIAPSCSELLNFHEAEWTQYQTQDVNVNPWHDAAPESQGRLN